MMKKNLKISEFAALSGITRSNLIFYDKIGLLCPKMIDETNRYRYYSYRQLDIAGIISVLREIGMPLNEIKSYLSQRSPAKLEATLNKQRKQLESQMSKLREIQDIIEMRLNMTRDSFKIRAGQIILETHLAKNLFLGPRIPHVDDLTEMGNYLLDFYKICLKENISIGFPFGTLVLQETIQSERQDQPAFFYCCLPNDRYPTNYVKPQGTYLVGYANTDYGFTDALYKKLIDYMKLNNLVFCGNAYEEYLLDEISVSNPDNYLLRIAIQVKPLV